MLFAPAGVLRAYEVEFRCKPINAIEPKKSEVRNPIATKEISAIPEIPEAGLDMAVAKAALSHSFYKTGYAKSLYIGN